MSVYATYICGARILPEPMFYNCREFHVAVAVQTLCLNKLISPTQHTTLIEDQHLNLNIQQGFS